MFKRGFDDKELEGMAVVIHYRDSDTKIMQTYYESDEKISDQEFIRSNIIATNHIIIHPNGQH